jgi:hypothetical protein
MCCARLRDISIRDHNGRSFRNCRRSTDWLRRSIPNGMATGLVAGTSDYAANCSICVAPDTALRRRADKVHRW